LSAVGKVLGNLRKKKVKGRVHLSISQLWIGESLAMWDHSITHHLTQVNTPHLNPSQTGWYSS